MTGFARALWRVVFVGAWVLASAGHVEAAGALAIGSCAAYGTSYDFSESETARVAALRKCSGACRTSRCATATSTAAATAWCAPGPATAAADNGIRPFPRRRELDITTDRAPVARRGAPCGRPE